MINWTIASGGGLYIYVNGVHGNVTADGNASIGILGNVTGSVTDGSGSMGLSAGRDVTGGISSDAYLSVSAGRDLSSEEIDGASIGY